MTHNLHIWLSNILISWSKLLEKVVAEKFKNHLDKHELCSAMQSAYWSFHSAETALVRMQNDLVNSLGKSSSGAGVIRLKCHY